MLVLQIAVVFFLFVGLLCAMEISLKEMILAAKGLGKYIARRYAEHKRNKKQSLKMQLNVITATKKSNFIVSSFNEAKNILASQRRGERMGAVYVISIFSGLGGILLALLIGNIYLVPSFGIGFMLVPIWIIKMSRSYVRKSMTEELEVALSGVTTSYMRTDNIVVAIEENIQSMNNPVKPVFVKFLNENRLINSNVVYGLKKMKQGINHNIFSEWCDAVIQCQSDRSLKVTLFPIINKFSDIKSVQTELDTIMIEPFKEFITLTAALLLIIPLLFIFGKDWFDILINTEIGKIILALTSAAVFVGVNKAVNLSEPIEYKR